MHPKSRLKRPSLDSGNMYFSDGGRTARGGACLGTAPQRWSAFRLILLLCVGLTSGACGDDSATQPTAPTDTASCGDDLRESEEACDGTDLDSQSCDSLGLGTGSLSCRNDCADFNTQECSGAAQACGNGTIQAGEFCDGAELDSQSCDSLGLGTGSLSCREDCAGFITQECSGAAQACGDGTIQAGEVCDGADLASNSCEALGLPSGTLTCAADCQSFVTAVCCNGPALTEDTVLDLTATTVTISGQIRHNGELMPPRGIGTLVFANDTISIPVEPDPNNNHSYSVNLAPGPYRVTFYTSWFNDIELELPPPAQVVVLAEELLVTVPETARDFDLISVVVTGTIRNALSLSEPPWVLHVGSVTQAGGHVVTVDGDTDGTYRARLFPGQHDFFLQGRPLARAVTVGQGTTQDFEVETVTVTGTVDIFSSPFLRFSAAGTRWLTTSVDYQDGSYEIKLLADRYDIWSDSFDERTPMATELEIPTSTTLDFSPQLSTLTGVLKVNGSLFPEGSRGTIYAEHKESGLSFSYSIEDSGPASFTFSLLTGENYSFYFSASSGQDVAPQYQRHLVASDFVVSADTQHDFDLQVIDVSGTLMVDGVLWQHAETASRRPIFFWDRAKAVQSRIPLEHNGTYRAKLYAGTYDAFLQPSRNDTPSGNSWLDQGMELLSSTTLDFDMRLVQVSGRVDVTGSPDERPALWFMKDGLGTMVRLDSMGQYSTRIVPGPYEIYYGSRSEPKELVYTTCQP